MISRQLEKLADKYDWKRHQDSNEDISLFGEFNGFLFTAMEGKGFKAFFTPVAGIGKNQLRQLKTWLEDNRRELKIRNYELSENFLCIRLQEEWLPRSVEKMESFLIRLTGILDELELSENSCAICGGTADKKGLYVGLFCHLHPECQSKPGIDFTADDDTINASTIEPTVVPTQETIDSLAASMNDYRQPLIATITKICSIPSVKGEPEPDAPYGRQTAEALKAFLEEGSRLGFMTAALENRAGYIEWGQGDEMVAALCHLDVVPAGQGWRNDPFVPLEINGRLTARGIADDKGPAVAVLYAMKALKDEGFVPKRRIRLIVGLDEENGSGCMEWYSMHEELPVAGFTADASFPVIHAEKGIAHVVLSIDEKQDELDALQLVSACGGEAANMVPGSFQAEFAGRTEPFIEYGSQAHASRPEDGVNAIIKGIYNIQRELHSVSSHHPFVSAFTLLFPPDRPGKLIDFDLSDEYGEMTVNPGIINLSADCAELTVDIRYPVTCDFEVDLKAPFEALTSQLGFSCFWKTHLEPLYIDPDSKLISTINNIYQTMTSTQAVPEAIGGGTYARAVPNIVAFGPAFPGDPDVCHQANESVDTNKLMAASAIYRETLRALAEG